MSSIFSRGAAAVLFISLSWATGCAGGDGSAKNSDTETTGSLTAPTLTEAHDYSSGEGELNGAVAFVCQDQLKNDVWRTVPNATATALKLDERDQPMFDGIPSVESYSAVGQPTITNNSGNFFFHGLQPGTYLVEVRLGDIHQRSKTVDISAWHTVFVELPAP